MERYIARNRITGQFYGDFFKEKKKCQEFIDKDLRLINIDFEYRFTCKHIPAVCVWDTKEYIYV